MLCCASALRLKSLTQKFGNIRLKNEKKFTNSNRTGF